VIAGLRPANECACLPKVLSRWLLLVLTLRAACCCCCCHRDRDRPAGSNAQGTLTVSVEFLPFSESLLDATVADDVQVGAWAKAYRLIWLVRKCRVGSRCCMRAVSCCARC
jgi:hypothetical protein